jgi:hypothetical protein
VRPYKRRKNSGQLAYTALMPSKSSKEKGKGNARRSTAYGKMQLECDTLRTLEAAEAQALEAARLEIIKMVHSSLEQQFGASHR